MVIDPGDNARAIMRVVQQAGLSVDKILNTHAHLDHVMAVDPIRSVTGAPFYLHKADLPILHDVPERARLWLDSEIDPIGEPDEFLEHGQIVSFGDEELEVRFTPGHAPGHVVFVHHGEQTDIRGRHAFPWQYWPIRLTWRRRPHPFAEHS